MTFCTTLPNFAVIIPFFQRSPGLLLQAVRSALGQAAGAPSILVVDDGSPIAAHEELKELSAREQAQITILTQPNAGPGAARNRALAALPEQVEHVAFLDSDDVWSGDHLSRALLSFAAGADFYFTDYIRPNAAQSAFAMSQFPAEEYPEIGSGIHIYTGDLFEALFRRSPVGTSTVACRRAFADNMFPVKFQYGEDVFFWMLLAQKNPVVAFSTSHEVHYGRGINIAAAAIWGHPSMQVRVHSEYQFHLAVDAFFPLTETQLKWSNDYRAELFVTFFRHALHLGRRGHPVCWRLAAKMLPLEFKRRMHNSSSYKDFVRRLGRLHRTD